MNPATETEFPLNEPPPRYPPTEISVWAKTEEEKINIAANNPFTFNFYPFNFTATKI